MPFTLTYRQGSFAQSEVFSSRTGAMARAYLVLEGPGCSNLLINEHGLIVAHEAEIISECAGVKAGLRARRPSMPAL